MVIPDLVRDIKTKKVQNFLKKFCTFYFYIYICSPKTKGKHNRGVAQLVSASGLGPEGPVFESQYPDISTRKLTDFQWVSFLLLCILLCKTKSYPYCSTVLDNLVHTVTDMIYKSREVSECLLGHGSRTAFGTPNAEKQA